MEAPSPAVVDTLAAIRAQQAVQTLKQTLKTELMAGMKAGGPTGALRVCAQDAQSLTAKVGADTGVRVGRSSLRLRNATNAAPPWVDTWLKETGERPAQDVQASTTAGVDGEGRAVVRRVAPLEVEPPCLICHGPAAGRPEDLASALTAAYPNDQASGYAAGDLRGAVWAEAPVVDTGLELELDGGKPWQLDESTRRAMVDLRAALVPAPTDVEGGHRMAGAVNATVTTLVQGCTMTGPAHDALHAFLEVLFPAIEGLEKAETLAAVGERRQRLLALVAQFGAAFE